MVGQHFANNLRGEIELSYGSNDLTRLNQKTGAGAPTSAASNGRMTTTMLMANIWYDVPAQTGFTPYVGGGLGVARVGLSNATGGLSDSATMTGSSTKPAAQLGFGARWEVGAGTLDLGYRYQMTQFDGMELSSVSGTFSL